MTDTAQPGSADALAMRAYAYENPRPDVQALVPREARRILDLGCSSGALGAALKDRQDAEVTGVERDPGYVAAARARLDRVLEADLEELLGPDDRAVKELGEYDCVIAADVLEHLVDPWTVLANAVSHLSPNGTAVISLPNVRYWQTFWMLGRHGTWPRKDIGLWDRTHLRFFTLLDAYALLGDAGLVPTAVRPQFRLHPGQTPRERERAGLLALPGLRAFFAFQYVIAARRR